MNRIVMMLVAVVALAALVQSGWAINVPVPNGDFETGTPFLKGVGLPPWVYGANDPTGNFFMEDRYGSTAPPWPETYPAAGAHAAAAFYKGGWAYNYSLSHAIVPNQTYTISFDARAVSEGNPTGWVGVQAYWISGSNFIAQAGLTEAETTTQWTTKSFQFTTDATGAGASSGGVGENLVLRLVQQDGHTGGVWHYVFMDNIQVSVTPEPMTMVLLGIGGLGLLRRRRA